MHLLMLAMSLGLALALRLVWLRYEAAATGWQARWNWVRVAFVLPPLVLITTAIALFWMGPICHMAHHQMIRGWQGMLTYGWASIYLILLAILGLRLLLDGGLALWRLRRYPPVALTLTAPQAAPQSMARLIPTDLPFIAQIGLWRPQLVVSQGLLNHLDDEHLAAVLCHEAAHQHYADTLWFAGLGLLRRASRWLPQTEALWQELLLLRELRADRWAAAQVDPLLLAEALYTVVSAPQSMQFGAMEFGAAFNEALVRDRLNERVDALLQPDLSDDAVSAPFKSVWFIGCALMVALLPLLTLTLHY
ncbi:M56 family metallopeptidase [filamentous cyanobacterium LEGE 11480]|uniref:M56 family metallopeptidase n=1 Tax=Romeriopsis navalis LEGE 11480 TaxID=2777977 RepID=A0A928Z251_9CYAN|nr:M56 family metallopeptidase [Romeriopsis navalis LEGE 11480]